ncbi:MAG: hypothetical protein V2A79_13395 [Planctomycetota bacterium]
MALLVAWAVAGCKENEPQFKTVTLLGTVEKIDPARSRVQISYYSEKYDKNVTTEVLVVPETEICINGELARLTDVKIGERAEGEAVVNRTDDEPVITVERVRIERAAPLAPVPRAAGPDTPAVSATSPEGPDEK